MRDHTVGDPLPPVCRQGNCLAGEGLRPGQQAAILLDEQAAEMARRCVPSAARMATRLRLPSRRRLCLGAAEGEQAVLVEQQQPVRVRSLPKACSVAHDVAEDGDLLWPAGDYSVTSVLSWRHGLPPCRRWMHSSVVASRTLARASGEGGRCRRLNCAVQEPQQADTGVDRQAAAEVEFFR